MTRRTWIVALSLLLVVAALIVGVGYGSTMMVVGHFEPAMRVQPSAYGLRAELISFHSLDGIELRGWWISSDNKQPARGTVILAHGSSGNRSAMLSRAAFLVGAGYNAFVIDLRAHGESGGNYMTPGYLESLDILGAVETAKRRGQTGPFVAFGHSYGAVASLWAAARSKEIDAVIADSTPISTYSSLKRIAAAAENDPKASFGEKFGLGMANTIYQSSWARGFIEWAFYVRTGVHIDSQYDDARRAIPQIGGRPIMFIVGEKDMLAPQQDSRALYAAARGTHNALLIVPGAGHNSTFSTDPDLYKVGVLRFLDTAFRP